MSKISYERDEVGQAVVDFYWQNYSLIKWADILAKPRLGGWINETVEADSLKALIELQVKTNIEAIHGTCQAWNLDITARVGSGRESRVSDIDVIVGFDPNVGAYGASIMTSNGPGVLALDSTVVVGYKWLEQRQRIVSAGSAFDDNIMGWNSRFYTWC